MGVRDLREGHSYSGRFEMEFNSAMRVRGDTQISSRTHNEGDRVNVG